MKKFVLLGILAMIISSTVFSQDDDFYSTEGTHKNEKVKKEQKPRKWSFGGNFSLAFGSITHIEVSPVAIYRATPRLSLGPGFTYDFYKDKYYLNYQKTSYGPKAIAMFTVFKDLDEKININIGNIIAYSEYELLNIERLYYDGYGVYSDGRTWINNCLVGGGIYQPIGQRGGGISIMILWDITQNPYSLYDNPIMRFGFYF